jgi:methionine--tRNA ligase beta chain
LLSIEEFKNVELRVARIVSVEAHEKARKPMYRVKLDLGDELGEQTVVAGIRDKYSESELLGKLVVYVANLEPKEIGGVMSNGMLLAAEDGDVVSLLTLDKPVKPGSLIH